MSDGTLRKKDTRFNVYLGLCNSVDAKPDDFSKRPPKLDIRFARETWLMPQPHPEAKHKDYRLLSSVANSKGPWWAGFADPGVTEEQAADTTRAFLQAGRERSIRVHQPYNIGITSEPVIDVETGEVSHLVSAPPAAAEPASNRSNGSRRNSFNLGSSLANGFIALGRTLSPSSKRAHSNSPPARVAL